MSNQIVISSGAKLRGLNGVITGTTGVLDSVPLGGANGVATLDSSGKVPVSQLPSSVVTYLGTWNAATNTPTLANGTGDAGDMYLCNVAGTVNFGAGPITFAVGDWVLYGSGTWQKSNGQNGTVTSVAVTESGDALTITGSPITTAGTINIGFAGTSAQYVAGDGSLITFPSVITEAQNLITEVYNETGATLTKGTIVYINGGHGNLPTITKAIATSDAGSAQTYGIVRTDITNNNNGYVVVIGRLTNLDTQAYSTGAQLYLSSTTAGAWTTTKQYAPAHLVYVGIVTRSHPTQGVVEVKIQNGYELDELHNVSAQTPSNNDGLFYNSSNSLWENKSIATALGYTPANDSLVVHLAGTETITGNKTFSNATKNNGGILLENGSSFSASGYMNLGGMTNGLRFTSGLGISNYFALPSATGYTFTFPNASGTLALTSDLSAYVTLGTFQTITGLKIFSDLIYANGNIRIPTAGTATQAQFQNASGAGYVSTGLNLIGFNSSNNLYFSGDGKGYGVFAFNNGGTGYTYTLPNTSGIVALTSNLSSYLPLSGGTLTGALNGTTISTSGSATFGSDVFTYANGGIFFNGGGSYTSGIFQQSGGNLILQTGTTPRLTIASTGAATFSSSVTAGTNSLFNAGSATLSNNILTVRGGGSSGAYGFRVEANNGQSIFRTDNYTYNVLMCENGGNVGIGTSSTNSYTNYTNLQVNGTSAGMVQVSGSSSTLASFYAGSGIGLIGTTSNHPFMFFTNDVERARILSNGQFNPGADNSYGFGGSGIRWAVIWAANGTIQTSDRREKKDIVNTDLGLNLINKLRPVSFKWIVGHNEVSTKTIIDENGNEKTEQVITPREGKRKHYGLIAQEVKEALGENDFGGFIEDEQTGIMGLRYDQFVPILIKSIQELEARLKTIENK
jgi:hypothetical protein